METHGGIKIKTKSRIFSIALFVIVALPACGQLAPEQPLDEVTVQLVWNHQAQFAGFYVAEQQGYYAEEDLKVNLIPLPEPGTDIVSIVLDGKADFGISGGLVLITARSQGQTVIAIATIYRRNPQIFFTLADSGINRPQDFPGHTMKALPPTRSAAIVFIGMMSQLAIDPDSVQPVEVGFDFSPFLNGEVEIWSGYITNEVLNAREQGYALNLILPETYGIHTYGDSLFASEEFIRDNPDLVLRFLRATLRGWQWAIENPEEAGALSLEYDSALDETHQIALMEASIPMIHTGEDQIGWMKPEIWQGMHDMLLEQGILDAPLDVDQLYTLEFLEMIYGSE